MKTTQRESVLEQLKSSGYISRNDCLKRFITRLGAIICDLNKEGWKLEGKFVKTDYGEDYVYRDKRNVEQGKLFNIKTKHYG